MGDIFLILTDIAFSVGFDPAPGFRTLSTGALSNVGNNGYSWSSTVSGTNGLFLYFDTPGLYTGYSGTRTYGFQLRCLSE
ncbi:hypothetical protein [uncultured Rikenella sp.]|uniref:hypothetical protein n=1 Tax=uncultured Rikenella sp. TaxID=368003 RepID=UPI0025D8245B|nr:hypothetical protein [uncultured Rikenella sp.]